ncbi:MAG: D-alanyl-D-alanine carboxypeptidase [Chlorobia bacterium]|nr:D-alanyl-D-alanine carboxypeptidase [Fimbriimonadaceae bacterium]
MATLRNLALISLILCATFARALDVSAKSAIIIDAESGQVLWQKDANTPRYPASTTKIMTAMLLLEHCLPSDWIVGPKGVDKIEPSSMNMRVGEKVSARGMLYALMLRSANDGCVAVAYHISGSVPAFAKLMNQRAKEIGCLNTNFNNPNGLNDKKHTTTAFDLALIAREAMKYEEFRKVVRTQSQPIVRSINHKDLLMKSHNKWLAKDMTADGIKTGYTRDAGKCYVGSATRDGYRLITVILKSEDWQLDHQNMLNWAYKNHARVKVATPGMEVSRVTVENSTPSELPLIVRDEIYQIRRVAPNMAPNVAINLTGELKAPIAEGQELGTVTFSDANGWTKTVPFYAGASTEYDPPLLGTTRGKAGFGILGLALVAGVFGLKTRSRRAKAYAQTARSSIF